MDDVDDDESNEEDDSDYHAMLMGKGQAGFGMGAKAHLKEERAKIVADIALKVVEQIGADTKEPECHDATVVSNDAYEVVGDEDGLLEEEAGSPWISQIELTSLNEQAIFARLCGDTARYAELSKQIAAENMSKPQMSDNLSLQLAPPKDGLEGRVGDDFLSCRVGFDESGQSRSEHFKERSICSDFKRGVCNRAFCRFSHGEAPSQRSKGGGKDSSNTFISSRPLPDMSDVAKITIPMTDCVRAITQDAEVKVLDPSGRVVQDPPRHATFSDATFPVWIMGALRDAGFSAPSQIQEYTWPLAMQMRDIIGIATTGSGKTLAFLLPAFTYMVEHCIQAKDPVLLVLAPTRELAVQIDQEAKKFGNVGGIRTTCCYGGALKHGQIAELRSGIHGVIGTPGRINDLLESKHLVLDRVVKLVLDEADRMLDMGFEPQIRKILSYVPKQRHTLFFSATWPVSVRKLAFEFLRDPWQVQIGNCNELKGNQDIVQIVKPCTPSNKGQVLMAILTQAGVLDPSSSSGKALIFCSTKKICDYLADNLRRAGVPCSAIHGDKDQSQREQALNDFKIGKIRGLVATDVAARGLDIKGITLVVNFDAPAKTEDYVQRIGRTGRAGQRGCAVFLVTDRDAWALPGILGVMRKTKQEISEDVERMAANARPPPGKGFGKGGGRANDRSRSRERAVLRKPPSEVAAAALRAWKESEEEAPLATTPALVPTLAVAPLSEPSPQSVASPSSAPPAPAVVRRVEYVD